MTKNNNAPIKWIWWGIIAIGILTGCFTDAPDRGNKGLSGKILGTDGNPQPGAVVLLLQVPMDSLESTSWLDINHLELDTLRDTTDENGNYSFPNLDPDHYAVLATYINGGDSAFYFHPNTEVGNKNVDLGEGSLASTGSAIVEIIKSGRALGNIICVLPEIHTSAISDADGKCHFDDLPPGDYQVIFVSDIYEVAAGNFSVNAGKNTNERNLTADYKVEFLSLLLQSSDGGSSIIPTQAVSIGAEKKVGIEAIPGNNVTFVRWEVKEGDVVFDNILDEKTNVLILENARIEAIFRKNVALRVEAAEGGSVETDYFSLAIGSPADIKATPDAGWDFDRWTVKVGIANFGAADSTSTDVIIFENTTITANFKRPATEVTLTADSGGTVVPELLRVEKGKKGTIQAVADQGYVFAGWEVVSGEITLEDASAPNTQATVNGPGELRAKFEEASGNVAMSSIGGGRVEPSGATPIKYGTPLSIRAIPDSGWTFKTWEIVNGTVSPEDVVAPSTKITCSTDAAVRAVFVRGNVDLIVSTSGSGSAAPAGTTSVAPDSSISLTATPDSNWRFHRWIVAKGQATINNPSGAQTNVTLQGPATIEAQFRPELVTLSFEQIGEGSLSPASDTLVVKNQAIPLSASAAENWIFDRWQIIAGDVELGSTTDSSTTVTLNSNGSIRAVFRVPNFELRASAEGSGTINLDTFQTVQGATPVGVTAAPAVGWSFSKWEVVSGSASFTNADSSSTTLKVTTDAVVKAVFVPSKNILTVQTSGSGTTTPSDTSTIVSGTPLDITATPADGWTFVNWTVVSGDVSFDNAFAPSTKVSSSSDATIQANFSNNTASLRVTIYGEGSTSPDSSATIEIGKATAISATAADLWKFDHWGVLSGSANIEHLDSANTTVTINGEAHIKAVFVDNSADLWVTKEGNGTTVPAEKDTVEKGVPHPISATPAEGFSFVGWEVIEGQATIDTSSSTGGATVTVTSNEATIKAVFSQDSVDFDVMTAGGGTTDPSGEMKVRPGTKVSVTGTPDSGAVFSQWKVVDGAVSIKSKYQASTEVTVNGPGAVKAYFKYPMQIVTSGEGTTQPSGATNVYPGDAVQVSADPAEGWTFDHWKVGSGNASIEDSTKQQTSITVNGPSTIGAVFKQLPVTLTVSKSGQGAISPEDTTVNPGSVFQVHAAPATSWGFSHWEIVEGNVVVEDSSDPHTPVQLNGDAIIRAHFKDVDTIFIGKIGEGVVDPAGYQIGVDNGSEMSVSATPAYGYRFDRWASGYGNVSFEDSSKASTTITINGNDSIAAIFIEQVTLDLIYSGNGSVTPKETVVRDAGSGVAITASPHRYNRFKEWKLIEGNAQIANKYSMQTVAIVNDSSVIKAYFEKFNIVTTSHVGQGETGPDIDTVSPGQIVNIGAGANHNQGWVFWEWTVKHGEGDITNPKLAQTTAIPYSDSTDFQARFVLQGNIKTLGVAAGEGGTTIPSGQVQVLKNEPSSIQAIPNQGFCFDKWTVSSGQVNIANIRSPLTTATVTTNGSVLANFKPLGDGDPNPGGTCGQIQLGN